MILEHCAEFDYGSRDVGTATMVEQELQARSNDNNISSSSKPNPYRRRDGMGVNVSGE